MGKYYHDCCMKGMEMEWGGGKKNMNSERY